MVEEALVLFTVLGVLDDNAFDVGAVEAVAEVAVFGVVSDPIIVFASFSSCFIVIHPGGQIAKMIQSYCQHYVCKTHILLRLRGIS